MSSRKTLFSSEFSNSEVTPNIKGLIRGNSNLDMKIDDLCLSIV